MYLILRGKLWVSYKRESSEIQARPHLLWSVLSKGLMVCCCTTVFVAGCETVGRREYLVTNTPADQKLLPISTEYRFGHLVDAHIQSHYMVLDNFEYQDQIQSILDELVAKSDRPDLDFTLRILNSNEANAFAGPGGYVYITTGLLDRIQSKDELAGVLAHEIGHVCARHSIKQYNRVETARAAVIILSLGMAVAAEDPDVVSPASDLGVALAQICIQGYGRSDELQADSLGVKYALPNGYNALASTALLRRLEKEQEEKTGEKSVPTLLSSHPPIATRVENMKRQLVFVREGGPYD